MFTLVERQKNKYRKLLIEAERNCYEKRTIKRIEICKGGICIEAINEHNNATVKVIGGVKYIVTVEYGKQDIRKLISNLVATEIQLNKHQGEVA